MHLKSANVFVNKLIIKKKVVETQRPMEIDLIAVFDKSNLTENFIFFMIIRIMLRNQLMLD